jgi:hypothetical protein
MKEEKGVTVNEEGFLNEQFTTNDNSIVGKGRGTGASVTLDLNSIAYMNKDWRPKDR